MTRAFIVLLAAYACLPAGAQEAVEKPTRPAVNAGRPTITDPASLTAPGWLEAEFGIQRSLDANLLLQTPLVLKLTSGSNRLEYRLSTDGYDRFRDGSGVVDGLGDTYAALHYLVTRQSRRGWDIAVRGTVKLPTASARRGIGTGKADYGVLLLASKDLSPSVHVDANLGYTRLAGAGSLPSDNQVFTSVSGTFPIPHSRWSYTDEIAYLSPISGIGPQVTTMHGFSYASRPWDVWDVALQFGLSRDTPKFQVLFGRTFFLGRLF